MPFPDPILVLLDIDGTLIDSGGAGGAALLDAFASTFDVPPGDLPPLELGGATDEGVLALLVEEVDHILTAPKRSAFYDTYHQNLEKTLRMSQYPATVLPGARELVERIAADPRFVTAALTGNSAEGARLKLDRFGLWGHIEFGVFGDDHPDRAELARRAVAEASRRGIGGLPASGWVVGDTPKDIACARAAGLRVMAVATGTASGAELDSCRPDVLVSDLLDPDHILSTLALPPALENSGAGG